MQSERGSWWQVVLWARGGTLQAQQGPCPPAPDFEVRALEGDDQVDLCRGFLGPESLGSLKTIGSPP